MIPLSRLKAGVAVLFFIATVIASHGAGKKTRLVTNLETGKKQVVVAFGTSLTANGAWVEQVTMALNTQFPMLLTLVNSGGSGKWSEWGVQNLDKLVISKNPDTVFIEFSINDSVERFKGSVQVARANLEQMIERILKANRECEVILMTMTPGDKYAKGHRSYRKDIGAHYAMYRDVADRKGLHIIDHYSNWKALQAKDKELFLRYVPDTIHPTAIGCSRVVTPVILEALGFERGESSHEKVERCEGH